MPGLHARLQLRDQARPRNQIGPQCGNEQLGLDQGGDHWHLLLQCVDRHQRIEYFLSRGKPTWRNRFLATVYEGTIMLLGQEE
jgi:hypothetical protein